MDTKIFMKLGGTFTMSSDGDEYVAISNFSPKAHYMIRHVGVGRSNSQDKAQKAAVLNLLKSRERQIELNPSYEDELSSLL